MWVGCDIAPSMLEVAAERGIEGDLMQHDMGHGLPFKAGTFDGVVSVSALQWLCNADKSGHVPQRRLSTFFTSLYSCLSRGVRDDPASVLVTDLKLEEHGSAPAPPPSHPDNWKGRSGMPNPRRLAS